MTCATWSTFSMSVLRLATSIVFHALTDKQRIGALPKFIHQDVLPLHGVDVLGQVVQDIVVDAGVEVSDRCRNEQQDTDDENGYAQFDDLFCRISAP